MADWQTISSLATAGGTLVLAIATFSAVRSSNRAARVADLLHGWHLMPVQAFSNIPRGREEDFRRLTIDLYVPAGGTGYWEGAIREADDPVMGGATEAIAERRPFTVELLYGDQEGGQRTISRFTILPAGDDGWYCQSGRHWNLDRPDPR